MTPEIIVRPRAEHDVACAFGRCEECLPGLGVRFVEEFEATLERISVFPRKHQVVHKTIRRALMRRFAYGVFFVVTDTQIVILAVLRLTEDPERWAELL